jgi:DegV family protein with EDD domain
MSRTAIITDTDSSLPLELAKKYNITQVPIIIQFGEQSFRDIDDMSTEAIFARVDKGGKVPTTAAPSPGQFIEAYKQAFASGADSILVFTISSEMSAVYAAALTAANDFPGKDITVVDTRTLCLAQGFMVLAAAEALEKGASAQEALAAAKDVGTRAHLFGALATLKYLAMSGRVGQITAGIANVLEVKPILTIREGKLDLLERVRTQSKAWARAVELAVEAAGGKKLERLAIIHTNAPDAAKRFEAQVRAALDCPKEILIAEMNPGLSIHTGTGWVGLVFITEK